MQNPAAAGFCFFANQVRATLRAGLYLAVRLYVQDLPGAKLHLKPFISFAS
jgi:hypothetical protein